MKKIDILSDDELMMRIKGDDQKAFSALYNRYWEKLLNIAYARLDDPVAAQDVVQQLFIDLFLNRARIEIRSSVSAYLFVALKYKVISIYRQKLKIEGKLVSLKEAAELSADSVEETLEAKEASDALEALLVKLPEKCRRVFELSRFEGKTQEEIAQELQISISTVKKHINKALKILKAAMQSELLIFLLLYHHVK